MKKRVIKHKKSQEYPEREKPRFCDPAACHYCEHIGAGNFVCNKNTMDPLGVLVVYGWEVTEKYLYCKRRNRRPLERR